MPQSVGNFIENQEKINLYGYKEGVKIFEEIKPTFKGIISKVGKFNDLEKYQEIEVSNMDFDLNEKDNEGNTKYLIAETSAKLHINKGNLAGYQFELKKYEGYNHKTKTFKVKQFTDTSGQKFPTPNTIYQFSVGDEFTLIDIVMPEIYITRAEKKLHEQALKEYEKISKNNLKYTLDIDPLFLKNKGDKNSVFFKIGDYIHLKDKDLNINKESRIISIDKTELPTNIATIDEGTKQGNTYPKEKVDELLSGSTGGDGKNLANADLQIPAGTVRTLDVTGAKFNIKGLNNKTRDNAFNRED